MKKEIIKIILRLLIFILIAGLIFFFIFTSSNSKPFIKNIEVNESKRYEDKVVVNVEIGNPFAKFDKATWCLLTTNTEAISNSNDWVKAENGYCSFIVSYKIIENFTYAYINMSNLYFLDVKEILEACKKHKIDKGELFFKLLERINRYGNDDITTQKELIKKLFIKIE